MNQEAIMVGPPASGLVAFISQTREYHNANVLPALVTMGFLTRERPYDDRTEELLAQLVPDLILLVLRPDVEQDLTAIASVARVCKAPVVVLLPGPDHRGIASALKAGADVCLRDTDGAEILAAQIQAIIRRYRRRSGGGPVDEEPAVVRVRDLEVDFDLCQARRGGRPLPLTPMEFKVLGYLTRTAGRVASPIEIVRAVQDHRATPREAQDIVKVYVRRIRRKLELDPAAPAYIITVRGFGYMLERRSGDREAAEDIGAA
jgi:DNA-binding response OmpR family regulator